ncbi:MAG TPA: hypothetical protein V6C57_07305, partial [Coleofasciculaceae cyanobacterium]
MPSSHRSSGSPRLLGRHWANLRIGLRQWFWTQRIGISGVLALVALLSVLNSAAVSSPALVQASPTNPQLGDTISVVIQTDAANGTQPTGAQPTASQPTTSQPTVVMNQKTYQTFAIAPNRFRALLPTTPLNRPGQLKIQVNGVGDPQTVALPLRDRDFPTQSIWLSGGGSDGTDFEFNKVDAF